MPFTSSRDAARLPSIGRLLLLSVSVFLCFILSADGAGAQTTDDHGNTISDATTLPLNSSVTGRIDPGRDLDVFKLDLSGVPDTTDVWIYTTGDLDTFGSLYDSDVTLLAFNDDSFITGRRLSFHLRAKFSPGIYYVGIRSVASATGNYTLHAQSVTDPGSAPGTAARLNLNSPTPGTVDTAGDADYFRLDLTQSKNLVIYAINLLPVAPIDATVLDARLREISTNVYPRNLRVSGSLVRYGFSIRDDFGPGAHYVKVTTPEGVTSHPVPYTIHAYEDTGYTTFIEECEAETRALNNPRINDPLYGCQWHLNNRAEEGVDINVESVWAEGNRGAGINIAIVDDGLDYRHEDLRDNVDTSRNHAYTDNNDVHTPFEHHGTHVAGIIAARDNAIGVRGVAPGATIYGYNFLAESTTENLLDATTRNHEVTAVSNNSWGPGNGPSLSLVSSFWELAVNAGLKTGYGGKGTFYVFSGGNGHTLGDDSNLSEYANYYGVTAVCAVNDRGARSGFSERGANLWVCAPSNDRSTIIAEPRGIATTENSDRYIEDFGGTSSSAPIVSGVAALVRKANPNLTWRDVKLILAGSARKNDAENSGWEVGARKYGSSTDRYHFNHEYGFGIVDASAAVDLAKRWRALPLMQGEGVTSGSIDTSIPAPSDNGVTRTVTQTLTLKTGIQFTEFVEINADFFHTSFRDMEIELESPSGAVSKLTVPFNTRNDSFNFWVRLNGQFRFGSARHLGEDPNGVWKLRLTDNFPALGGTLRSWSIKVYGHSRIVSSCATGGAVSGNPGLVSDCEALLASRDTLAGTALPLNWSAARPMAEWDGVTISGTPQRVTGLDLLDKGLTGTIPAQLGRLSSLQVLRLNGNQLTGEIPTQLGSLSNLQELWLIQNQLTGEIPSELGSLANLEHLWLRDNELTGEIPAELGDLANMTHLYLNENQLTGEIPAELGSLTNLVVLSLNENQLTGEIPTELGGLTNLRGLALSENQLTGEIPAELGDLSNLTVLSLSGNQLTGEIPSELGSLANMTYLYLNKNQLTGEIPAELGSLANLEHLWLRDNELTGEIPAELGDLANMTHLYLNENQLTGEIPAELGDLANLEVLLLARNQLTGELPSELGSLANLTWLELSRNELTGGIPSELGSLANMTHLYLNENQLTGEIPAELGDLANLTHLYLNENQLTGGIPSELGSLANMTHLYLNENQLTGEIPAELGDLANLTVLSLSGNQLTGEIPSELGSLANLGGLGLYGNELTGEIPSELGSLTNLVVLSLNENQLTGEIPAELGSLANLTHLSLNENQLTGEIPAELGSLTNLVVLYLNENQLTGEIPAELGSLTNLVVLSLNENQLTGEIPAELGSLANLGGLGLYGNELTGEIPAELGSLTNLVVLSLNENQLTGEIPAELGSLANLEVLLLARNQLTGCIPAGLLGMASNDFHLLDLPFCPGGVQPPPINAVTAGPASLTIAWAALGESGGSAIIAYDLRYIERAAADKSDANWTVVEDVWTTGSGPRSHQITGLTDGTQYDVQVRAVSSTEVGIWSAAATGTPATWWAVRSFSPESVGPRGRITVTIDTAGLGAGGTVTETLPIGFSYMSSSLPDSTVNARGRVVEFTPSGETAFTYTVGAPQVAGSYSFSGVLTNSDGDEVPVGGAFRAMVGDGLSVNLDRSGAAAPVRIGTPIQVTATFSEPVTDFDADDITVSNGVVGNFAGSGAVYTFDVTPNDIGAVTVDIAASAATDDDGKWNSAALQLFLGIPYDDNNNGTIEKNEVISAINDYLFEDGSLTKAHVIALINHYLFG